MSLAFKTNFKKKYLKSDFFITLLLLILLTSSIKSKFVVYELKKKEFWCRCMSPAEAPELSN